MDIFAHTLWSAASAKVVKDRTQKIKSIGLAAFFGVAPDFFAFGPFIILWFLRNGLTAPWPQEPPGDHIIPQYVHELYHISHSLVIFAAVFALVWLIRRKPYWELSAWALHILIDIPTHTSLFFPTPFLWPLSSFQVSGIKWSTPWFMILNYSALILVLYYLWVKKKSFRVEK